MSAYDYEDTAPTSQPARKTQARHIYAVRLRTPDPALQPALDFAPPQPASSEPSIEARFAAFHAANPHVYAALRRLALAEVAQGARVVRTKHLFEQLRAAGCATASADAYKLNNIFTSHYARLLDQEPELAGRIPMRAIKAQ